jgi:uncharacterized phage protein gp47/JayE
MSRTPPEISARMIAQLKLTAPGLSLELGTVERKIIDAAAEAISEAYIDQYLVGSLLDIDTKVGLELEQFVGVFGYGRYQGKAAEGVVRVTLNTAAPQDYQIPVGSQFFTKNTVAGASNTGDAVPLYFTSTSAVVLTAGSYSIDVPVRCAMVGTIGNVPSGAITYLGSVIGSGSATNLQPLTGGVSVETDQELRQRFKDTLLRNIAGTSDWYRSLCLQNDRVSRVAVYGPVALYRTQIAAPASTYILPVGQDVKYVWKDMHSCFINQGQTNQKFYSPLNDYSLSTGAVSTPTFTRTAAGSGGQIATGEIVNLEFQYTPKFSRNDPSNSITNKVDVFVDGIDPVPVTEKTIVTPVVLSATTSDPFYTGNFQRVGTSGSPTATNRFTRLGSVPLVSFPSTITVASTVFTQGTHYHVIRDTTLRAGSPYEVSGIEWEVAANPPAIGTQMTLTYTYNRVPEVITHVMSSAKQIGSDVMIHQADFVWVRPCLSIQYDRSYTRSVVDTAITERLKAFFSSIEFGGQLRVNTLLMSVQQVLGVVDAKLTVINEVPACPYGIELYNDPDDPSPTGTPETADFKFDGNTLPVFKGVVILAKAAP